MRTQMPRADGAMVSRLTHQVLGAVQLVCSRGAAGDKGLKHAAHHHCLHVLRQRLVVPCGEVVTKARLVWKQQEGRKRPWMITGGSLVIGMRG